MVSLALVAYSKQIERFPFTPVSTRACYTAAGIRLLYSLVRQAMQHTTSLQDSADRVSTLELFFDLVFVFTITQVSDLLLHAHSFVEFARPSCC